MGSIYWKDLGKPLRSLQVLLVGLDHLLDHLATDGAGLAAGQVAVVTVLQVDAHLLRCVFTSKILREFVQ